MINNKYELDVDNYSEYELFQLIKYNGDINTISEDELRLRFTKIRSGVQKRVASMPKHAEYLRQSGLMKG